ncbi:DUF2796 domain-containing protein [Stenotrophomonas cyclobalanopsidis]|uniref:DUF2796 domain-containing protein n=1 Tax=Stenotrophomonas cyclobalanopsidis TaxID=2771362 RepID=A0ABQ6SWR5_9GAMM|nr:DUF2796 domain-containing protein [Stenotrophomonas cyclobalanopsidis]KAA8993545.1 DUF2796 domain-containing protein [Stenotrophomonas cyclobalanopsidis]
MKRVVVLSLLFAAPAVQAHDVRQLGAHVHGQATVDLAVDQGTLELALQAPGVGILDFERPPANATEQAALHAALATLKRGDWLTLPTAAQCTPLKRDARAEGFGPAVPATATTPGKHTHAGFNAELRYQCANPAALRVLVLALPKAFPNLHEVIVNSVTAAGQSRTVLNAENLRVVLAP